MLQIKLKSAESEKGLLTIEKYDLTFPYSLYAENNERCDIFWSLNSINCKNVKGSFRLLYCYKIDFSNAKKKNGKMSLEHNNTRVLSKSSDQWIERYVDAKQFILFPKKNLFYLDEKNVTASLYNEKKKLSSLLLKSEKDAIESIQFFLLYNNDKLLTDNEEVNFFLNLSTQ